MLPPARLLPLLAACAGFLAPAPAQDPPSPEAAFFQQEIRPILAEHCFDCHADGTHKGGVSLDTPAELPALLAQPQLWLQVLKNIRGDLMPPAKNPRLPPADLAKLLAWIKSSALHLDPQVPDPGRVTLRRLNRVEYRNTIRDLMGIDFRTDEEFPADDTGYGFDTIGDVLTTSPLLLEKYLQAAETITARAVPLTDRITPRRLIPFPDFHGPGETNRNRSEIVIPLYDGADLRSDLAITQAGTYRLHLDASIVGSFPYDPGKAQATWFVANQPIWNQEIQWQAEKKVVATTEQHWKPGRYPLRLHLVPRQTRDQRPPEIPGDGQPWVDLRFRGALLEGPLEPQHAARPDNYARFFPPEGLPEDPAARHRLTRAILQRFASLAFRRPADPPTVERLALLAEDAAQAPDGSFQKGIARALTAVLASPRFLFRLEETLPEPNPAAHPLLDEPSLAARLSYFLWSTTPDAELTDLANRSQLRAHLRPQIRRLLADQRSQEFVKNFAGQWLQARDVESVSIDARVILARDADSEAAIQARLQERRQLNQAIDLAEQAHDAPRLADLKAKLAALRTQIGTRRIEFSGDLRSAMRRETELYFRYLLQEDRSVLELIDSRQTFLNNELAKHYDIPGVDGPEMRLVDLPPHSPRGGVLTMGSVLAVTSNPTRTSPVKRGLFILDNILGTPPPPAPPNIPSLDASSTSPDGRELSNREALEAHRAQPLCASCHNRMDPLGFALENFNAMGLWRDQERGQPLPPPAGQLITGESFANIQDLKHLIVTARRADFYRCLTEKLLTYALGRGPQPGDLTAIDAITERLEQTGGEFSSLIIGLIESTPFQKRRRPTP